MKANSFRKWISRDRLREIRAVVGAIGIAVTVAQAKAADLGSVGPVFPIAEPDFLKELTSILKEKEASGELAKIEQDAKERISKSVQTPAPVEGLSPVMHASTRYYDPTMRFTENVVNERGEVMVPAGTTINPLDQISLKSRVLIVDARDDAQLAYARHVMKEPPMTRPRLVLVGGSPIGLSKEFGVPVYFDQRGYMTTRLDIKRVPVMLSQEGRLVRVDEIYLGSAGR
jgi:conjugal transfer pilus assembly protein TraW